MITKVKTITNSDKCNFDGAVNGFMAKDFVSSPKITFSTTTMTAFNSDSIVYIAHIEYNDVRQ